MGLEINILPKFHWHSIKVKIQNERKARGTKTHIFSVIENIRKDVNGRTGFDTHEKNIFHLLNKNFSAKIEEGEIYIIEFLFFGFDLRDVELWQKNIIEYFTPQDKNYKLLRIWEAEEHFLAEQLLNYSYLYEKNEICLDFLAPLSIKNIKGKCNGYLSNQDFISLIEKRISRLFSINFKYGYSLNEFEVLPYYWKELKPAIKHTSKNTPGIQYINGFVGKFYLKGNLENILPLVVLCSKIHIGNKLSNSQGYFRILNETNPHFNSFPSKSKILANIREAREKYDWLSEEVYDSNTILDENQYAEIILNLIKSENYHPEPSEGFYLGKKNNEKRLIEKPSPTDLVVQYCLLKEIRPIFDKFFEEESLGFRKGVSINKLIGNIEGAIKQGYRYVLESDIEDFFHSIDLQILGDILDFYLPDSDILIKNLLLKFVNNGYMLNNEFFSRKKGLSQGSPLSPILANLYLDYFDEEIKQHDVKLIRYADDFIILCKTEEQTKSILKQTNITLSKLNLKINLEKTKIGNVNDGFCFVGLFFDSDGVKRSKKYNVHQYKKPLYVLEPYSYLKLNNDTVHITKNKETIQVLPLRYISSIILMEQAVFSNSLIRRCIDFNIPVTLTLNTGYYITTIKPDSKKHFDISAYHYIKHTNLSYVEKLTISQKIVISKIENFEKLAKQRYKKGDDQFFNEIKKIKKSVVQSASIEELRGLEGFSSKLFFRKINEYIRVYEFMFTKRERFSADPFNSLLNFGYYLLFANINACLRSVGLNPYLGFLHSHKDNYESLVADLQEPFRAYIIRFILRLVNLKIIKFEDFVISNNRLYLSTKARKIFIREFEEMMAKESIRDKIFKQVIILKLWTTEDTLMEFHKW